MSDQPQALPHPVRLGGSRLARALLRLVGWELVFDGMPARQGVLIMYPHTSNWDFPLAMLAKWGIGIPVSFWTKESLFRFPLFGRWLRWIGAVPVRRGAPQGQVVDMVERMRAAREADAWLWLGVSPEGTRGRTEGWRSGFYRVATGADVPLALGFFDYASRRIGVAGSLRLTGRPEADLPAIATLLAQGRGKRPDQAAPIRFKP